MIKLKSFSVLLLFSAILSLSAQNLFAQNNANKEYLDDERVLMNIGGDDVSVAEFMNVYLKNNVNSQVVDKKTLDEYLDLYINFKLKVRDAEERGMDTLKKFRDELAGYRKQLAQPYFVDESITDELVEEAYERMQQDIRASHILMKLDKNALPEDTLRVYNEMMKIRKRILKGENFNDVAREVSEDPSARDRSAQGNHPALKGNGGDLGFFTVFNMVYPFETAAYQLDIDEVSMPVRSDFGYHLIKTTGKYPAMGKVQVAHIYFRVLPSFTEEDIEDVRKKAEQAFQELQKGASWEETVKKYSDDRASKINQGLLPKFGVNRMVPEFIEAIRPLDTGEISKPVLTNYGFHIIKLVDREEIGTFEEEEKNIRRKLKRDSRGQLSKEAIIARIKKEYGLKEDYKALQDFYAVVDSGIFDAQWEIGKASGLEAELFTLGDTTLYQHDFAVYLNEEQKTRKKENLPLYINAQYQKFVNKVCRDYEDLQLEKKYPQFRLLVKEYRDGILLFDLTDKVVWSKAIEDTAGLRDFHQKHMDDYMWDDRKAISIIEIDSLSEAKATSRLFKKIKRMLKKLASDQELIEFLEADTTISYTIEKGKYEKGVNKYADQLEPQGALPQSEVLEKPGGIRIIRLLEMIPAEPKKLNEARGMITADYQNFLEKEWIKELRAKYAVDLDSAVLKTLR